MDDVRTLLRREESYAIHALIYAAENPGTSAASMAEALKLPPAFLAKVLRKLAAGALLDSKPGRNGGVTLSGDPTELSLLDVVEAVSGALVVDTCQVLKSCATQQRKGYCRLNTAWVGLTLEIRDILGKVRLSTLIDPPHPGHPDRPATTRPT